MKNPTGLLIVTSQDKEYKLWLGMSVLAKLQAKHGRDCLNQLEISDESGEASPPDIAVIMDIILFSLSRYHKDADEYTADEIFSDNRDVISELLACAFPDAEVKDENAGKLEAKKAGG